MSDTLAIAAVTKTLAALITPAVTAIDGAVAVAARPDEPPPGVESPHVRIFLYRVEPNAAWRNCDLPTRRADGTLAQIPRAALNLQYLLSFHGEEHNLVPHRLLASTVLRLHEWPLLSRELIQSALSGADNPASGADLADQPEQVRLTPLSLSLDDLTKLWTVFPETAYQLSVGYEASVVLLNSEGVPSRPLPVREPRIYAITLRRPHITRIVNAADPRLPITAGDTIQIQGSQLRGETTRVRLVGKERVPDTGEAGATERFIDLTPPPAPGDLRDDAIRLALPAGLLTGLVSVQVLHEMAMGEPEVSRPSAASNLAPLLLQPSIESEAVTDPVTVDGLTSGNLRLGVAPEVATSQRTIVHLNLIKPPDTPLDDPPVAHVFAGGLAENSTTLIFPFTGVRGGAYLVRVQIDGIDSPLTVDNATGKYIDPAVDIP